MIKDDDDVDDGNNNNNNNNNNSAQTVLKKGRLVHPKNVLLGISIRNGRPWNTEHPASTYGLWKVKLHNISKCFKSKMQETIHQGERHFQNVHLNFCLVPATYG